MHRTPLPVPLRRVAIELLGGNAGQPATALNEQTFQAALDVVTGSPQVTTVDLGVLRDATDHPAFAALLRRTAAAIAGRPESTVVVWVSTSGLREWPALPADIPVAFGLLPESAAGTLDVLTERFAGALRADERKVAQISLAVRPDDTREADLPPVGGCPILEQGALFFGVDGAAFACQRHAAAGVPLAGRIDAAAHEAPAELARMRRLVRLDRRAEASPVCATCPLGISGVVGEGLRDYWTSRDDAEPVALLEERVHLFRDVAPTPHRAVRVDLGCGPAKTPGFVGVDRFPLPGVDVVSDLDQPLPFAADSVDYIIASHSLEHIADLPSTIEEVFRVCRDRAIVTIISPYHATGLNRANPYHKQVVNEHTARFFTNEPTAALVSAEDYLFPHAEVWGLGSSDHRAWCADLRPLITEYFYFPPYRALDETSKRVLRSHLSDVCDQMLTHLVVVKSPIEDQELKHIASNAAFQETASLRLRRALEAQHAPPDLFANLPALSGRLDALRAEISTHPEHIASLAAGLANVERQVVSVATTQAAIARVSTSLASLEQRFDRDDTIRMAGGAKALEGRLLSLEAARAADAAGRAELEASGESRVAAVEQRALALELLVSETLHAIRADVQRSLDEHGESLRRIEHLDTFAARTVTDVVVPRRRGDRVRRGIGLAIAPPVDLSRGIGENFQPLIEHSLLSNGVTSAHRLIRPAYLRQSDVFTYPVTLRDLLIEGVEFAVSALNPPLHKTELLALDICDPETGAVLRSGHLSADEDDVQWPVQVYFDPLAIPGTRTVHVRVAGLEAAAKAGLRIYEWRRRRLLPYPGLRDPRLFGRVIGTHLP